MKVIKVTTIQCAFIAECYFSMTIKLCISTSIAKYLLSGNTSVLILIATSACCLHSCFYEWTDTTCLMICAHILHPSVIFSCPQTMGT